MTAYLLSPETKTRRQKVAGGFSALSGDNAAPTRISTPLRRVDAVALTLAGVVAPADGTKVLQYEVATAHDSASDSYVKTDNGAQAALLTAKSYDRVVSIVVTVDEAFANAGGTQTTFEIGKTGAADFFAATSEFTDALLAAVFSFTGILAAGKELFVTANDAAVDGTGGITVVISAIPFAVAAGSFNVLGFSTADGADPTLVDSVGVEEFSYMAFGA